MIGSRPNIRLQRVRSLWKFGETKVNFSSNTTPKFKDKFIQTMFERGFIYQCTDIGGLDARMNSQTCSAYLGFDATATSLHVGSLIQIMILRHLQKCGHKPIVLVGGGTTKVGDPTGKDESRKLLSEETIQDNVNSLTKVFEKFLTFGTNDTDAVLVNNADWLDKLSYLDFLRDYGRYFTINRMLAAESVKQRLAREQPFSFLEFNYILLQSYDFVELHRRHRAVLQLGGSDQWGNIVSGVELGRKCSQYSLFGLTTPLITTSDGRKMGKSESGAVWLDRSLLSEFDYWQFWRNTADADVINFLKLFTEVPMSTVHEMELLSGSDLNAAKALLADEATALLHGKECLSSIHATAASLFSGSGGCTAPDALSSLEKIVLTAADLSGTGIAIASLLLKAKLVASKKEGLRLIRSGGLRINDAKVDNERLLVSIDTFNGQTSLKLSIGKKNHVLVVLANARDD